MRPILRVIVAITLMRRPHAAATAERRMRRNGSETFEIPLQYDSVTSFDDAADA